MPESRRSSIQNVPARSDVEAEESAMITKRIQSTEVVEGLPTSLIFSSRSPPRAFSTGLRYGGWRPCFRSEKSDSAMENAFASQLRSWQSCVRSEAVHTTFTGLKLHS